MCGLTEIERQEFNKKYSEFLNSSVKAFIDERLNSKEIEFKSCINDNIHNKEKSQGKSSS